MFALFDHGSPVAWFAHERLRDVRPTGPGSSLRRSVLLPGKLREPVERLLRAMAWHGPAMVELRDDGLGAPTLIEVNGRFWGSLELTDMALETFQQGQSSPIPNCFGCHNYDPAAALKVSHIATQRMLPPPTHACALPPSSPASSAPG